MSGPVCPVCDAPQTDEPWTSGGGGSLEICPRCGIQFGYTDSAGGDVARRARLHAGWRAAWLAAGGPEHWRPERELRHAIIAASAL